MGFTLGFQIIFFVSIISVIICFICIISFIVIFIVSRIHSIENENSSVSAEEKSTYKKIVEFILCKEHKNNLKKVFKISSILSAPIIFVSLPWILLFVGLYLSPNPPAPQYTYGEFPIHVEYKIGDKSYSVDDVVICEFEGVEMNEGEGKYNSWHTKLKSGKDDVVLYRKNAQENVYISTNAPEKFMKENGVDKTELRDESIIYSSGHDWSDDSKKVFENSGIKIIKWYYSEPNLK